MQNLIGAIVIAAAVGGAIVYTGHQDRLQRQCLAAMVANNKSAAHGRYSVDTMTGGYCAGWPEKWRPEKWRTK